MSRQAMQTLLRGSSRWARNMTWAGLAGGCLCFLGIKFAPDSLRVWPVRGFFLAFISMLVAWTTHYAFIVLDELNRRKYGTVTFMSGVIAGFGWLVVSCVRGMMEYR